MKNINDTDYGNTDEEYNDICYFLNTLSKKDPFMHWESGRMNYWRYNLHANKESHDRFFSDNVHVWRANSTEIVGLCISEYGKNDMFVEVLPMYQEIYPDMFRWIESTWGASRTAIEIDVYSGDISKINRLEAQGFSFNFHFENKRIYNLEQVNLKYALEKGFTIQALSISQDFGGRVALVQSAFENFKYTENNVKGLIASPDYIEGYDLSVLSPDKQQVAYCIGWHNRAEEKNGYIEPVGSHAGYRRRGFAKAVITECFMRMKGSGIHRVEISSNAEPSVENFLYDSLSPQTKKEVHKYAKMLR